MQAGCKVGGLTESQGFLPDGGPDGSHHDQPGMHPQAHGKLFPRGKRQPGVERVEGMQQAEPRPPGPLGVVVMRHGIAEVHEQAIAEVLRDIAVKAVDHCRTGLVIRLHDRAQVFRVQAARQLGGVHQITEHDREMPAFRHRRWEGDWGQRDCWWCRQRRRGHQGPRAAGAGDGLGVRRDECHKAIAPPGHRGNEARCLRCVAQGAAQLANGDAHHRIAHRRLGPDGVEQDIFGDQTVRMGDQVVQHVESFGRQRHQLRPTPETGVVRIEAEVGKAPLRGRHKYTSRAPAMGPPSPGPSPGDNLLISLDPL